MNEGEIVRHMVDVAVDRLRDSGVGRFNVEDIREILRDGIGDNPDVTDDMIHQELDRRCGSGLEPTSAGSSPIAGTGSGSAR